MHKMVNDRKRRISPYISDRRSDVKRPYRGPELESSDWVRSGRNNRFSPVRRDRPYGVQRKMDKDHIRRPKIDRKKTCPMLVRLFCNVGKHNKIGDYSKDGMPPNELRIYTWKDASLKELMQLVIEVFPEARKMGTCFDFSVVYANQKLGVYSMKDLGSTCSGQRRVDDNVTLEANKFKVGDILDVAIFQPRVRQPQV